MLAKFNARLIQQRFFSKGLLGFSGIRCPDDSISFAKVFINYITFKNRMNSRKSSNTRKWRLLHPIGMIKIFILWIIYQ